MKNKIKGFKMKLSQLNEAARFKVSDKGLMVYLDTETKTFKVIRDEKTQELHARGLTHLITDEKSYNKIAKIYGVDVSWEDWVEISNKSKEVNKDPSFRKALAAMAQDVLKNTKD